MADSQPIFGLSDEQIQALQQAAQQNQAAQVAQMGGIQGPALYYRSLAGQGIGNAISGAMGYQDPTVQRNNLLRQAQQLTDVQARAGSIAPMSPEYMQLGAQNLDRLGLKNEALHAMQLAQEMAGKNAAIGFQTAETKQMNTKMANSAAAQKEWTERVGESVPAGGMTNPDGSVDVAGSDKLYQDYLKKVAIVEQTSPYEENRKAAGDILKREKTGREHMPPIFQAGELLMEAKKSGDPARIEMAQKNYDLVAAGLEKKSEPNSSTMERAHQTLIRLKLKNENGEKMTREDILNARQAQSIIESQSTATRDPNTGTITMVQNRVPDDYSVDSLLGNVRPKSTGEVGHTGGKTVSVIDGPGARPSDAEMKILSEGDVLNQTLTELQKTFNKEFTGPVAGRVGSIVGATFGNPNDRAEFIANAAIYKNRTIKFITGAQMSESETARLINEIPDVNDPPATFEAKMKVAKRNQELVIAAYKKNMQQGNIRPIGGNDLSTPTNPALSAVPGASQLPNPAAPNQPALQNVSPPPVSPPPPASSISKAPALQTPSSAIDVGGWKVWQEGNWIYRMNPQTGQLQKREVGK